VHKKKEIKQKMTQLAVAESPSSSKCSWEVLIVQVFMIYIGTPGAIGILGSIIEFLIVTVTMCVRGKKGSNTSITSIAGQTQYMIAAMCLASMYIWFCLKW